MSIKNKTAIELLSLIASLMDEDDIDHDNDTDTKPDKDEFERACAEHSSCDYCPHNDYYNSCVDDDEDDEWDDECPEDEGAYCDCCDVPERKDKDALTIEITIPDGMPCIVMGGTDDELPLAIELIKEMGLVSPTIRG